MPDNYSWGDSSKGAPPNDVVLQRWPFGSPGGKSQDAALVNVSDGLRTIYGGIDPNDIQPVSASDFKAINDIGQLGANAKTDWWKDFRRSDNVEYDPSYNNPEVGGANMLKKWAELEALLQKFKEAAGPPPTPIPPINMQKPTSPLVTPAGLPVYPGMGIRG
jgi:hypothetical protein